ncbi:MAG: tetratricopeptide repeat protein [Verrucomicrobiota bacterium JB022]|nr:tetratricopeptide repeat protein [Verrucomicrobiota bacterium JB022]
MKHLLWLISLLAFTLAAHAQSPAEDAFYQGNTAYASGDYPAAIEAYEQALELGGTAAGVHANLASAYYQNGDVGPALLEIEKALVLAPADPAYRAKWEFLRTQTNQPITTAPLWAPHALSLPLNGWVVVGTLAVWLVVIGVVLPALRWLPTYLGGGLAFLGVLCFLAALPPLVYYHFQSERMIVLEQASLRVAPTEASPTTDAVAAGASVKRLEQHGEFVRVALANGATGYLPAQEVAAVWE